MFYILNYALNPNYQSYDWGLNFIHAFSVSYLQYGLSQPVVAFNALSSLADIKVFGIAAVIGFMIYSYLFSINNQPEQTHPSRSRMGKFIKRGFIIFVIGFANFLFNWGIQFSTSGTANMQTIASSVGVALTLVGILGYASTHFNSWHLKRVFYSASITLLCLTGLLLNSYIASFWTSAFDQEKMLLKEIQKEISTRLPEDTVILDGFCSYHGPAVLFDTNWALKGALMTIYREHALQADLVTPHLSIQDNGIRIPYHDGANTYPFKNLHIYNVAEKKAII